jgi:hypothetical protein
VINNSLVCSSACLLLVIAACDQSTGLSTSISQAAANTLAADMDAVSTLNPAEIGFGPTFAISAPGSVSTASVTVDPISITVTRQCPQGGTALIAGTISGTGDPTTRSFSLDAVATRTDTDCAFQTEDGILTLNGHIAYDAKLNIVNGALSGLQTQTQDGTFSWSRPGGSGTCDIHLSSSYDPATHTATVTGAVCGKDVSVTRTR